MPTGRQVIDFIKCLYTIQQSSFHSPDIPFTWRSRWRHPDAAGRGQKEPAESLGLRQRDISLNTLLCSAVETVISSWGSAATADTVLDSSNSGATPQSPGTNVCLLLIARICVKWVCCTELPWSTPWVGIWDFLSVAVKRVCLPLYRLSLSLSSFLSKWRGRKWWFGKPQQTYISSHEALRNLQRENMCTLKLFCKSLSKKKIHHQTCKSESCIKSSLCVSV